MSDLPEFLPVIVLEDCNLFPGGLLPLYIFEARYREMVADALAGERMFCVGTIDPEIIPGLDDPPVFAHSTAGLIRACVENPDGTAHLILEGQQRVRFLDWNQGRSYWRARVEPVASDDPTPQRSGPLVAKVLRLARSLVGRGADIGEPLVGHLDSLSTPDEIVDFIAYHFLPSPLERQALLGMEEMGERLDFLVSRLEAAVPDPEE